MSSPLKLNEIRLVPVEKIKLDPSNPNFVTKEQMDGLRESFRRFGYLDPIVLDQDYLVANGEHRLAIFREFGLREIPAYVLELSDTERRLLRQMGNKLHGQHEPKSDALELKLLYDAGELPNLSKLIAQDSEDILRLLQKQDLLPFVQEDSIPEVKEARVKKGELWQLGRHRLMCGDSTSAEDVQKLTEGRPSQLCLTDPPYSLELEDIRRSKGTETLKERGETYRDPKDSAKLLDSFISNVSSDMLIMTYMIPKNFQQLAYAIAKNNFEMTHLLIWNKSSPTFVFNWHYLPQHEPIWIFIRKGSKTGIWNVPNEETSVFTYPKSDGKIDHPTPRPLGLWIKFVTYHTERGQSIYDPFGGSGTTLIACEQMGRICLTMEIDPHYCDLIIARWEKLTGQKAELISEPVPA